MCIYNRLPLKVRPIQNSRHSQLTLENRNTAITVSFTNIKLNFDVVVAEIHPQHTRFCTRHLSLGNFWEILLKCESEIPFSFAGFNMQTWQGQPYVHVIEPRTVENSGISLSSTQNSLACGYGSVQNI